MIKSDDFNERQAEIFNDLLKAYNEISENKYPEWAVRKKISE